MPRIVPAKGRATSAVIPGGVRFTIPARRRWFVSAFLLFWLCGWAMGEVAALRSLFGDFGHGGPPGLFLVFWLLGWTVAGAFVATTAAWSVAGREIVSVAGSTLAVRREVLGLGRTSEYDAAHVRNLRVGPAPVDPLSFASNLRSWGLGGGLIAFDYGARTYRFGAGVDEAEAAQVAGALRARLPAAG